MGPTSCHATASTAAPTYTAAVCYAVLCAVRTLNRVAMTHPMAVTNCNIDMEALITDQNRSIATLAITTLLKTGAS